MLTPTTIKKVRSDIGRLVRLLRKQEKMTQEDLAKKLGLSRMTIKNIESGQNATLDTFFKILQHFGLLEDFANPVLSEISNRQYESLY